MLWAALLLVALFLIRVLLSPVGPDAELARTAREAVRMAGNAHRQAEAASQKASALRALALVTGVLGPLALVYLIYRLRERSEPHAEEILELLQRENLIQCLPANPRELSVAEHKQLKPGDTPPHRTE